MYILPDASQGEIITALETDVILFPAGMTLRLFTNDIVPDKTTTDADLVELTNVEVPGYAPTTPTWAGTPHRKNDGSWEDWTDQNAFVAAGGPPPAPIVVFGWMLENAGGTVLAASGRFASPFTFSDDGDGFNLKGLLNVVQLDDTHVQVTLDFIFE